MRQVLAWLAVAAAGCAGEAGPRRYQVSGRITYASKPVPAGSMSFEPDTAQGNRGPGGSGQITAGRYATHPGFGVVGGAYVIRVTGFDGKPVPGGDLVEGRQMFPETELHVELPAADAVHDIDIPAVSDTR